MKSITDNSYDLIQSIGYENISFLPIDTSLGTYMSPYTATTLETFEQRSKPLTMYTTDDLAFVNTAEFSRTGQHFLKYGTYTDLHPTYDRAAFTAFWDEEEKRCREGMTIPGRLYTDSQGNYKIQEVHITGEHYGYLNYAEIKRSKDFEHKGGILYGPNGEPLVKTEGNAKSYSLPSFWDGDYYFFKAIELCRQVGKHLVVGKARRKGYSYKNAWIIANRANLFRRTTSVVAAYNKSSLTDDGTMNKVQNYLNFLNKNTDWTKGRIHNTLEHIEIGFKAVGVAETLGFLSNIYTAVLEGDPGAIRGKDADLALVEEAGKCKNLAEALAAALKAFTDGIYKTGLLIVFGTGGGDESYWADFEDLFYKCYEKDFIMFQNKWDKNMEDTGCGFFHPCYMNKPGLIDIYGNSDIKGALAFNELEKDLVRHDPIKLIQHEMEEPEMPSQAFSRATNNIMPAKLIEEQLRRVLRDPSLKGIGREGIFVKEKDKVKFIDKNMQDPFNMLDIPQPVLEYPLKPKTDVRGCFVMFEPPYRDKDGNIPENLYHAWNDPFGISKDKDNFSIKDSLAVTYIYETTNNFTPTRGDRIVGMYVGRTEDSADYDKQMFYMCEYYNAKLLYENDRGDVFSNAKALNYVTILKDEPEFHYQKDLQKGGRGRKKGISIAGNPNRKLNGVIWVKNWLLQERGFDENGNKLLNLHYIYDVGLLTELLKYDGKRNADRISALIVGMFDMRESLNKQITPDSYATTAIMEDDYFKDPFR